MKQLSGVATVVTAGTPVVLGSVIISKPIWVKAPASNTGVMYLGNDGADSVSSTTGYHLAAGDTIILDNVYDLSTVYVNASVSGEKLCWLLTSAVQSK
jgi:hypothetical protein